MCVLIASRVVVWWAFRARAPGKRLCSFSLWQSFASGFGSQQQQPQQRRFLLRRSQRGSGSPDPGQGWSEAGVGDCPLSETFFQAFGFSMRKWLVRAGERGALRFSLASDIFTFQTPVSSFHLSWFWHV